MSSKQISLRNNVFFTTPHALELVQYWEEYMEHNIEEFVPEMKLPLTLSQCNDHSYMFEGVDADNKKFSIILFFGGIGGDTGIQVSIEEVTKTYYEDYDTISGKQSVYLENWAIKRGKKKLTYSFYKNSQSITLELPGNDELYIRGYNWRQSENWESLSEYLFNLRDKRKVEDVYAHLNEYGFLDHNSGVHFVYTKKGSHKVWDHGYSKEDECYWIDMATEHAIAEALVEHGQLQLYSQTVNGTFVRAKKDGSYELLEGKTRILYHADSKEYQINAMGKGEQVLNLESLALIAAKKAKKLWKAKNIMF